MTSVEPHAGSEIELLSFRLGEQEYAVPIMAVREIRGWTRATPMPKSPACLRGVINLRGTVLPVIDLGVRLGMEAVAGDARNVIIVVQYGGQTAGLLVDAVSDILTVAFAAMQPPPAVAGDTAESCIGSLTIVEGRMIRLLDLGAALPHDESEAA